MRPGLTVLGHRMSRRGDRPTALILHGIVCLAIVQIALALAAGLYVTDRELGDRLSARDVGRSSSRSGERSTVVASTDLTRRGEAILRYAVVTEHGRAPGFAGTSIGPFEGCILSPALRARTVTDAALAERYCGNRPVRTMPKSALLQPEEFVAIVYRRGPLPSGHDMDPTQTVTMGRDAVPWLWNSRRTDALARLVAFLVPVALAGLLSMRTALAALQRRDAPWAETLAVLGADRRGVALFTAALSLPAAVASSALAVIVTLGLWHVRVNSLVFGHQETSVQLLAPTLFWVIPLGWLLMVIASVLPRPKGIPQIQTDRRGRATTSIVISAPIGLAVALGQIGGLDRTQRLVALYVVGLWLLVASPDLLRTTAGVLITPLVARRPGHGFLVPWRTILGGLREFSRSAAPLLAGSLVLAITIAASHLIVDGQVAFLRQSVATGQLGTGFQTTAAATIAPVRRSAEYRVLEALMIDPGQGPSPVRLLSAPCTAFEDALGTDLPCSAAGVRLRTGDFVPPAQTLPSSVSTSGAEVVVDQIASVDSHVAALLGTDLLVFSGRSLPASHVAWGPDAEITPIAFFGGTESSLQEVRTSIYRADPSATLRGPRSELSASVARYTTTTRRFRALAALLLVLLVAGQAVGSASHRRADRALGAQAHLLGAAPPVTRRWTAIRQISETVIVIAAASTSITLFGLAADRLDILAGWADYLSAGLITTVILGATLAMQLGLGALAHVLSHLERRTER